ISLGLKQTQEDPWQRVVSAHRPGDVLEGTVTKVVAFGAFVEILPGVEGLVHISELADHHVESPNEVVQPGATLNVKILEIDEERRRLSLSIKRVEGQNMPMGDLAEQMEAAAAEGEETTEDEDEGAGAAGPVAAGDPPPPAVAEASSGAVPPTAPPAAEAVEEGVEEPLVAEEEPEAAASASEEPEVAAEEPAAEAEIAAEDESPEAPPES
ncbi:MAG TPA: S1 RNA-binding domain-containing protein, partial [Solirubrobacterales bacterium]